MPRYIDADEFGERLKKMLKLSVKMNYINEALIESLRSPSRTIGLQDALRALETEQTVDAATIIQSGWISVKDKMPEDSGDYIVLNDGRIEIAPYDKEAAQEGFYPFGYEDKEIDEIGNTLIDWIEISGVTHWMPLPEPPQEEE